MNEMLVCGIRTPGMPLKKITFDNCRSYKFQVFNKMLVSACVCTFNMKPTVQKWLDFICYLH